MANNLKWKGNTGGGTLGQRGLIFFFRWWNLRLSYAFMAMIVPFYLIFGHKSYLSIYHYFRQQFGLSKWQSFRKTYRNHILFGQVILDRFAVFAGRKNDFEVEVINYDYYKQLEAAEKGFVIVGTHFGNFELAGYMLTAEHKRFNALVFGGETQTVQQNRAKILNNNNISLIKVSDDMSHLFELTAALQRGEIVSMPADRILGSQKSVECNFLRGKVDFPIGAFALAVNAEVEALTVFCVKTSTKKYKIFVIPCRAKASLAPTASKREKIENLVHSYVSELENIVKQYPEQWFNYYEFWKSEL